MATSVDEKRGILVAYYGHEYDAVEAASKHFGLRKTLTPHDLHLKEVVSKWMLDPRSPRQTGDYSGWEQEEIDAMEKLVNQLY